MKRSIISLFLIALSVDALALNHPLVDIKKSIPTIAIDLRYATKNNFTGKQIYPVNAICYVHKRIIKPLKRVQKELRKKGLGLKIWDAFRPLAAQRKFWKLMPDERYVSNPAKGGGRHTRGLTLDCTLIDLKTSKELEMPTAFDDFSQKAHSNFMDIPKKAISTRKLLHDAMNKYGFYGIGTEWWHFDYKGWRDYPVLKIDFSDLQNN